MTNNDFKKYKELQSVLPVMKMLGFDAKQAEKILIPSEKPDFHFIYKNHCVGIEVTECHPEITKGENAKNQQAAQQRTWEICKFVEETQDAKGEAVNYRMGFNFGLLFDLQKPKLRKHEKERIQNEIVLEMHRRINNGDYIVFGDDYQKLHLEWGKDYHYIRHIIIDSPLEKSIVTYSYPSRGTFPIEHDIVIDCIGRKEAKLLYYRENKPLIEDFWLCVNIPMGTNRTTDGIEKLKVETLYDRIYLTSNNKCIRIK